MAGVTVVAPDDGEESAPPAPGPVARALSAADLGYPVSLPDLEELIENHRQRVERHPSDARSWAVLGTAYVERARRSADASYYVRAEQALKRSLRAEPDEKGNAAARVGMARLADARHDFAAAKKWGEEVRARHPEEWAVYPALVEAYEGLGDLASSRAAVRRFAELRPGVEALLLTARTLQGMGRDEDAVASAREAADRADTPARKVECLYLLGELAWERGEPQEAVAQYGAALAVERDHRPSLAGRAGALVALGRADEARRDYEAALADQPNPAFLLELGELYESLGRNAQAREQYERLRSSLSRDQEQGVDNALLRGRFEAAHGEPTAAVALLTAEWARSHRSAAVADALGWALHLSGDSAAALPYAERAVAAGARKASYVSRLGAIQWALKDYGPARRHLTEALRTNPHFSPLEAPAARRALDALDGLPTVLPRGVLPAPAPADESVPPTPAPAPTAPGPRRQAPAGPPVPRVGNGG
ncbi:tetratricopeptide repeat protein [Streptomyces sp. NPDC058770]|uniref:tetratricopeptide repeat protein n=1 Tax=Streptomyces sp. NPDC058770 TaxID=3346631 RepID=UPI0036B5B1B5